MAQHALRRQGAARAEAGLPAEADQRLAAAKCAACSTARGGTPVCSASSRSMVSWSPRSPASSKASSGGRVQPPWRSSRRSTRARSTRASVGSRSVRIASGSSRRSATTAARARVARGGRPARRTRCSCHSWWVAQAQRIEAPPGPPAADCDRRRQGRAAGRRRRPARHHGRRDLRRRHRRDTPACARRGSRRSPPRP